MNIRIDEATRNRTGTCRMKIIVHAQALHGVGGYIGTGQKMPPVGQGWNWGIHAVGNRMVFSLCLIPFKTDPL
jgi:hypothetical protein